MSWPNRLALLATLLFLTGTVWAQEGVIDDIKTPLESEIEENREVNLFTETIKIISASKKIFVVTNSNQQLGQGDFVSLVLENNLAIRALVAKVHDGNAGLKVLKIYSLTQWGRLRRGQNVQIIRGDDSRFGKKTEVAVAPAEEAPKIKTEDDLYNSTAIIDDDPELEDDSKRHIKPDNVLSVGLGFTTVDDAEGGEKRGNAFSGAWAYQFTDNWFAEFFYGRTAFDNYPGDGAQTVINNVVGRLKYNFKAPLYSFIMPYLGFQSQTVSSPNAGEVPGDIVQAERERELIDDLKKTGVVVGVTLMRRLVPGWFVKADLGTDVLNVGVAIEF